MRALLSNESLRIHSLVKVVTAVLLLYLVFALSGCASNSETENSSSESVNQTQSEQQQESVQIQESNSETIQEGDDMSKMVTAATTNGELVIKLANNSSADALWEMLADGPIVVEMADYANMEKVGSLGRSLPTNDESLSTTAGDVILYQGDNLVIYYSTNNWTFTKLGRVQEQDIPRIKEVLGSGDITVTLSIN